ncbi:MAG: type 4a pilus biogenesis protein PilO [Patescibacteria group bacterium]
MKQSAKRLISSVTALLLIVAAFVSFFNLVKPAYSEVFKLRGEETSLEGLKKSQGEIVLKIQKLIATYNDADEARETVSRVLPATPSLAEALAQVNGLALNNTLTPQFISVSSINVPVQVEGEKKSVGAMIRPIVPVVFQIKLTGSYGDFKKFLDNIQTNVRLFDIGNLTVQPINTQGKVSRDLYSYDLSVVTYYQSE